VPGCRHVALMLPGAGLRAAHRGERPRRCCSQAGPKPFDAGGKVVRAITRIPLVGMATQPMRAQPGAASADAGVGDDVRRLRAAGHTTPVGTVARV
jgi:hypothetical protein